MSLTHVHAFFVASAIAVSVLCGAVALFTLTTLPSGTAAVSLAGSVLGTVLLARYEARFVREWRQGENR